MVNPIYIIAGMLGAAFLHPLLERGSRQAAKVLVITVLVAAAAVPLSWLAGFLGNGVETIIVHTAGFRAPVSINLQAGLHEALFLLMINSAALLGALYFLFRKEPVWEGKPQILFLMLVLGINGLVLTRDLFNIFVFLEITSIALYALIAFNRRGAAFEAGFKYMIAGGIASGLFLIGVIYLYRLTGTLNIDTMIASGIPEGAAGTTALFLVVAAVLVELKPFPANGWGADAYEAADPGVSAMASAVSATGILFVLYKISPLFETSLLRLLAVSGGATFLFSQLLAMKQQAVRRMLGYSSIGQIGLLVMLIGLAPELHIPAAGILPGGITAMLVLLAGNHLFSKAGLFWMSGIIDSVTLGGNNGETSLRSRPGVTGIFGILTASLSGFPPFPAFWAKWLVVTALIASGSFLAAAVLLLGSLLEAWYLMRWFLSMVRTSGDGGDVHSEEIPADFATEQPEPVYAGRTAVRFISSITAPAAAALLLVVGGLYVAITMLEASGELLLLLPVAALLLFTILDLLRIPGIVTVLLGIASTALYGYLYVAELSGLRLIFGLIFIAGSAYQMFPLLNRKGRHPGLMGMLMAMILSLGNLLLFTSSLGLFFSWEIMTVSSFFLIARGKRGSGAALRYILFSLAGAFLIMVGLALAGGGRFTDIMPGIVTGTAVMRSAAVLLGIGFIIKMGSAGLHIWLPGAYAEADDDLSTFFAAVLSKAGLFMLFLTAGLFTLPLMNSEPDILRGMDLSVILGWIGVITAFLGASLALFKEDIKYTLAYSSMGQVGYMLLSFALMSQLGWMNSIYLAVTHLLFKGMLFVAVSGVIARTGTRMMYRMGGLISRMPISFFTVLIAIIALSGVPPLTGFGAKWMLYTALIEKGWYLQAGVAMFASAIAFLYLFRLIHTIFLGQLKDEFREVREAPVWTLIPQFVGIIGIMLFSMYPNLLLKPIEAAIAPYFSGDILWEGYTVISTLGYWNGNAVMFVTMGVFIVPLVWMLIVQRKHTQKVKQFNIVYAAERPYRPETTHYAFNFFAHYRKALGFLYSDAATRFWRWIGSIADVTGGSIRKLYSGNLQTYVLLIVLYVSILLLVLRGGF